jgi:hypothetical protein
MIIRSKNLRELSSMAETKSKRHCIIFTLLLLVVAFSGDMISVGLRLKLAQRLDIAYWLAGLAHYLYHQHLVAEKSRVR